jgi:hypothetical protein
MYTQFVIIEENKRQTLYNYTCELTLFYPRLTYQAIVAAHSIRSPDRKLFAMELVILMDPFFDEEEEDADDEDEGGVFNTKGVISVIVHAAKPLSLPHTYTGCTLRIRIVVPT